jgi:hypothetical protein
MNSDESPQTNSEDLVGLGDAEKVSSRRRYRDTTRSDRSATLTTGRASLRNTMKGDQG